MFALGLLAHNLRRPDREDRLALRVKLYDPRTSPRSSPPPLLPPPPPLHPPPPTQEGYPRVLDVGVGSGYLLAAMAEIAGAAGHTGHYFGIDRVQGLVDFTRRNLLKAELEGTAIQASLADGRVLLEVKA